MSSSMVEGDGATPPRPARAAGGLRMPPRALCGRAAVYRVELYAPKDGRAHGSLDAVVSLCLVHTDPYTRDADAAGFTPYRLDALPYIDRCGEGFDYVTRTRLTVEQLTDDGPVLPLFGASGPGVCTCDPVLCRTDESGSHCQTRSCGPCVYGNAGADRCPVCGRPFTGAGCCNDPTHYAKEATR